MNTRLIVAISLLSGLAGGLASHFAFPVTAFAQPQSAAPVEITAQSFILVNGQNKVVGRITTSPARPGDPGLPGDEGRSATVVILDASGRELWPGPSQTIVVTPGAPIFRPLSNR